MSADDMEAVMTRERLLAGAPVTERRVQLAGVSTAVLEGGAGQPVVLLHGGIECGGVYWAPVLAQLAERHRADRARRSRPGRVGAGRPVGLGVIRRLAHCADRVDVRGEAATRRALPSGQPRRALRGAARRCAPQGGDLRDPGRWAYRLPPGLMVAAIRFDLRPSQRNMDRFARWAFLDPDLTAEGPGVARGVRCLQPDSREASRTSSERCGT